ncbi:MAG: MBL fold metallo-hydrolase [Clostridia bacterium]|jgi:metallo-beta-lactamase family protein
MKITFLGAAKTVTGSCFLVETKSHKFLVDCGMFQGRAKDNEINEEPFQFKPGEIDFVLLTHAHIDHSGRIPKLYKDGFNGEIIATKPTVELCGIMLPDSGHIQETENEWDNRKRQRAGKPPIAPLYTLQDAVDCQKLFKPVKYFEEIKINDEVTAKFNDAGHILGSAIIEIWIKEDGKTSKIVFTGDLGNRDMPLLRDRSLIESTDFLVIESTYGNKLHEDMDDKVERFVDIILDTIERGGNIIIPSFAIGRTQEIIYDLNKKRYKYDEKMKKLFTIPVYIDSPLAISATEIFRKNIDCFDEEAQEYIKNGDNPLDFPGLQFTRTADESKELNNIKQSSIIISASGMCDAGRIKHHLKHNLWRKESSIVFVGYQALGTLGRRLADGEKNVKIFGEDISVKAKIETIEGFSGHADMEGLMDWIGGFKNMPCKIFVIHGEENVIADFSKTISNKFNVETVTPDLGNSYTISADAFSENASIPVVKNVKEVTDAITLIDNLKNRFDKLSESVKNNYKGEKDKGKIEKINLKLKSLEEIMSEKEK